MAHVARGDSGRWRELPAWRRQLVYGAVALGLSLGAAFVAGGPVINASARALTIAAYGLATLLSAISTVAHLMQREETPAPRVLRIALLLLTLILAALTYDAIVA